jgi:hypothetical protein
MVPRRAGARKEGKWPLLAAAKPPAVGRRKPATLAHTYNYEAPAALATGAPIASANPGVRTFSFGS